MVFKASWKKDHKKRKGCFASSVVFVIGDFLSVFGDEIASDPYIHAVEDDPRHPNVQERVHSLKLKQVSRQ